MSSKAPPRRHPLKTLGPYFRPYRLGIALGLILVVVSSAFQVLTPTLIGRAIDAVLAPIVTHRQILVQAALIVLVAVLGGVARYIHRKLLNGISRRIETDLRVAFFDKLLRLDAAFFSRIRTGDLMSRAVNDISNVRAAIGPSVMYLVNTVATTAFALALMTQISVQLTLIALIPMLLMAPVTLFFGRVVHGRYERIQDHLAVLSTMVQENLSGARIVRAYVQERAQEQDFDELSREYIRRNMSLARVSAVFDPLLTLLSTVGLIIVLYVGGRLVIEGRMTEGQFVAFHWYLVQLTWPMIALGWVTNQFQRGMASYERIRSIMDTEPAVTRPLQPVRLARARGKLEFRHVSFHYPDTKRAVLKDVTFLVEAGQRAAIVGPTGAGKSTIVALLTRRYDPSNGRVLLDDVPIEQIAYDDLRTLIATVPQDAFVFSETIAENIALGLPSGVSGDGRIERVAEVAQLTEAIAEFPMGFQTRLGERGVNLSGGQRQRTTLARALARDPRVLILDDALSAVDTHTETAILDKLRDVLAGRTSLIISHRVTAVMHSDVIFVLDDGRIVERGSHEQLLAQRGLYTSLLQRQLLEEGLDDPALAEEAAKL